MLSAAVQHPVGIERNPGWSYETWCMGLSLRSSVFFWLGSASLPLLVFLLGLPGRIAHARKHPEAEAVNLMGWVGFMAVVPWIQGVNMGIQAH